MSMMEIEDRKHREHKSSGRDDVVGFWSLGSTVSRKFVCPVQSEIKALMAAGTADNETTATHAHGRRPPHHIQQT